MTTTEPEVNLAPNGTLVLIPPLLRGDETLQQIGERLEEWAAQVQALGGADAERVAEILRSVASDEFSGRRHNAEPGYPVTEENRWEGTIEMLTDRIDGLRINYAEGKSYSVHDRPVFAALLWLRSVVSRVLAAGDPPPSEPVDQRWDA